MFNLTIEKKGKKYLHTITLSASTAVVSTRLATQPYAAVVMRLSGRDQWVANKRIAAGELYAASYHSEVRLAEKAAADTTSKFRNQDAVVGIVLANK